MDIKVFVDAVVAATEWFGVKINCYAFNGSPDKIAIYAKGKCISVILTPYESPDKTLMTELNDELNTELGVYTVSMFMRLPTTYKAVLVRASEIIRAIFTDHIDINRWEPNV